MSSAVFRKENAVVPSAHETELASQSSKELAGLMARKKAQEQFQFYAREDGQEIVINLPAIAIQLLLKILTEVAAGNAVTLMPIHAMLTTQEAANLLNVSRPFLVRLLDKEAIPCHKVGKHRRIRLFDLLKFKESFEKSSNKALDELTQQAQELDLGY